MLDYSTSYIFPVQNNFQCHFGVPEGVKVGGAVGGSEVEVGASVVEGFDVVPGAAVVEGFDVVPGAPVVEGFDVVPGAAVVDGFDVVPGAPVVEGFDVVPGAPVVEGLDVVPGGLVVVFDGSEVVLGLVVTGFVVVGSKIQKKVKCHFHTYGNLCNINTVRF